MVIFKKSAPFFDSTLDYTIIILIFQFKNVFEFQ